MEHGRLGRTWVGFLLGVLVTAALLAGPASAKGVDTRTPFELACEILRNRVEAMGFGTGLRVGSEAIRASAVLQAFYEARTYRLAWSGNGGPLPQVDSLVAAVHNARREGLRPEDYHMRRIAASLGAFPEKNRAARPIDPRLLVDLDLLLTDAFLSYGFHLVNGRLDSESIDPEWYIEQTEVDLRIVLEDALARNRIGAALEDLAPRAPFYRSLRQAMAAYREMVASGGWPAVPEGGKLATGSLGERVRLLRERLQVSGDLAADFPDGDTFDGAVEEAVRRFQRRHGLEIDGVVGPKTLAALKVTAGERLQQIEVNMERWRWLPKDLGDRYIQVNIAGFDLDVFEASRRVMNMRAITGRDYRRTPVFSDMMTYIVINPYWNVPWNIAVKDKLPLIKENPEYLTQQNMKLLSGWDLGTVEIDPSTIDWSEVTPESFRWRLRQTPGPLNALGRIKFMFPNKFNVYLHDTPTKELFDQPVRAFSSGCIRIQQPIDLAEYLLRGYPEWTRPAILAAIDKGEERTVKLPEPIPVYILYCTAWVDDAGEVCFRNDVYGRDKMVSDALGLLPPSPEETATMGESQPGGGR
jgi:murein L,D-transpeptidase YcbB/YkuD